MRTTYSVHAHDFDFLAGEWSIHNRRLKHRLAGSNEWEEFPATLEFRKILNGLANLDQFHAQFEGAPFEGVSLRVFNPATEQWTIYWMDTNKPMLAEQVVGAFENGRGEFFGEEEFNGGKVKLRFLWSETTTTKPRWEQAYFDEAKQEWETNWVMKFSKSKL